MPKRQDIHSILILGAGPIVIGQACEFDYSGTQACRALKEEGYRIILVNSNPATIMTDPKLADATYIEPVHWEIVERIIEKERPDAILPTMGGQTALNCALNLAEKGVLERFNIEMIGATPKAIRMAEDREEFREAMRRIGLEMPHSVIAHSLEEALALQPEVGFPAIIRPSFTMGGTGGGIAYNREEFKALCERGLDLSLTHELLIDESVLGWKEYEMEVVRDKKDNAIIVCSIENFDPMGVHTGDSITVAPAQTLTDKEYQRMRDASLAVLREIGVDTGGSNVQFAVNPKDGRLLVIEMNPRVSRSSALASKATGFPIAKVAAKLAVGYTLDELINEVTGVLPQGGYIPASFEPSIDYVVTKIPRFNFDKFPQTVPILTTQMKSVGEVMAMGRTFQESLQKAIRALEIGRTGLNSLCSNLKDKNILRGLLKSPTPDRLWYIADAFRAGFNLEEIHAESQVDPWFLAQIQELIAIEQDLIEKSVRNCSPRHCEERSAEAIQASNVNKASQLDCFAPLAMTTGGVVTSLNKELLLHLKRKGFSDAYLAGLLGKEESWVAAERHKHGIIPSYKRIDTCAAEFPSTTAYMYSTYEPFCESRPSSHAQKVIILGGGPNRIGQGIEFDYCCVHAALALKEVGYEAIMINCNPETVSTDFDISSRLYFEPVTFEDVMAIVQIENPVGVIVHYGGQTPLRLAKKLEAAGVPILGTSADAIDCAEDRARFQELIEKLHLKQPENGTVRSENEAIQLANQIGYPLVVRPSYVLGGQSMEVVHYEEDLKHYLQSAVKVSNDAPVLLDRFLNEAIEVDVDAICDGKEVFVAGVMEHIEQAGVHSGDSACTLPAFSLSSVVQQEISRQVRELALALGVVGLLNAQFAVQGDDIYILEVNPRASRTVPFVSKAIGLPLARIATYCKLGRSLQSQGISTHYNMPHFFSVKLPVFPFNRFPGADSILGPEMKSTGEVMGIASRFGQAYARAQLGANVQIPRKNKAFISVKDADKARVGEIAKRLVALGFSVVATRGTARVLEAVGIQCIPVNKVVEGRPHIVDFIKNNEIDFVVNTTEGKQAIADSFTIRESALQHQVRYTTTLSGAEAACLAMKYEERKTVTCLQALHETSF